MAIYKDYKEVMEIYRGDITGSGCDISQGGTVPSLKGGRRWDAVVNAANPGLAGGGGVDGAIHDAAGPMLHEECRRIISRIKRLPPGEAVITPAYLMKTAKHIIHTVGPVWRGGGTGEEGILSACYSNCLKLAWENGIKTIAFPAISTGVYGYPPEKALKTALAAIKGYAESGGGMPEKITLVFFDESAYKAALKAASSL